MLALQILDNGQTFLHSLEDRPLTIGSADDADIRLSESGVSPHHARIEPRSPGGLVDFKIVDLDSREGIRVNGVPVAQMLLSVGDRVEIGRAVLVLGQQVQRPAGPDDVLESVTRPSTPEVGTALTRTRRARVASGPSPARRVGIAAAIALGLGVAAFAVFWGGRGGDNRVYLAQVEKMRRAGSFDEARGELGRLRDRWGDDAAWDEALRDEAQRIADVESAVADRRQQLLAEADGSSYAELMRGLLVEEKESPQLADREAARILRSGLKEMLAAVGHRGPRIPQRDQPTEQQPEERPGVADQETVQPRGAEAVEFLADADRLATEGQFAQAIETLRTGMAGVEPADANHLRERLDELRIEVRAEMQSLVGTAQQLEREGKLDEAVVFLAKDAHRFPASGDLALLSQELESLRGRVARGDVAPAAGRPEEKGRGQTNPLALAQLQSHISAISEAEWKGDYALAVRLLDEAAQMVAERDPRFAARLRDKAGDYGLLVELSELVAVALPKAVPVRINLRDGRPAEITGVDGAVLLVEHAEGNARLSLQDLPSASVELLLEATKPAPRAYLCAAVLGYRSGDRERAEQFLVHALRADRTLKEEIDAVITRGRHERPDEQGRGYTLVKGRFVSAREIDAEQLAKKLEVDLAKALRRDEAARTEFVEDVLAQGPTSLDALLLALRRQHEALAARLTKLPVRKQYDRLLARREEIDVARRHALELIYDVKTYFPKPSRNNTERLAEYNRVQQEVDKRIAAVREIWDDDKLKVKVPTKAFSELTKLDWLTEQRASFRESDPALEAEVDWLRSLPRNGEMLTLRTFCYTAAERQRLQLWDQIETYNAALGDVMNVGERTQVAITNAYRRMFNHRPLAVNPKVHAAARGHADEMSTLGYFAHRSPTPGRHTPFDRMKLEGYNYGVSENIAINGSSEGAHWAWLHSSGHHRNLLNAAHTEFGVGVMGRYYVQNFGRGEEFVEDERFINGSKR